MSKQTPPTFATLVQEFFTDYMMQQRALSPSTVASYRDTFVLLLRYAQQQGKGPNNMGLTDISPKFLAGFLDHLEQDRHNSVRSRNIRLAAVRSFLKFAARRDPAHLRVIEQALAVPMKRFDRKMVGFVPREQMLAVIDAPRDTWIGQRDRLMLMLMFNTGARVSEVIGVRVAMLFSARHRASGCAARDVSSVRCLCGRPPPRGCGIGFTLTPSCRPSRRCCHAETASP